MIKYEDLPPFAAEIVDRAGEIGATVTLVGGAVRDYLISGVLPADLDFEIRCPEGKLEETLTALGDELQCRVERLPFLILRLERENVTIEVAPVREEVFANGKWFKHDQFTANLFETMDYKRAWERRDFTVNAIGVEFGKSSGKNTCRIIDPFGGIEDLKSLILKPCGENFFKDPVRFLRAVRFKISLGAKWSPKIENKMGEFNLKGLVPLHFFNEAIKSGEVKFFCLFFDLVKQYRIELNDEIEKVGFLRNISPNENIKISSLKDILQLVVYKGDATSSQRTDFCQIAGISVALLKSHEHLKSLLDDLAQVKVENIKIQSVEEFISDRYAELLKNFHQVVSRGAVLLKKDLCPKYFDTYQKWLAVLPRELEGKSQFNELSKDFPGDRRSYLAIYCHLKANSTGD